ncbi:mycofactocin-coupled SDR family oxidoreductase [Pseudonocardia sp.]|jgi:SDR family mycofactocin-dependent oxidoreductase|uniref:mycofactocin-coupled SDR family oxidoreductase n=1 Tax=Pseudonocardia sp. TaxID=60912 RepID=UPI0026160F20|nr:mycofactocin-coupled SDR family oxidoreductase [Pseudonocardia sp.]MCW2721755.1 family mycofactocin-dependent oxidoreductase [Pseudonocardia sp.]
MGRVDGKVVLITGIARGQGRAHAVRLAEEGADIVGVDLLEDVATNSYPMATQADLDETVRLVEKLDRRIVVRKADVRDRVGLREAVDACVAELGGRLDGVVAQAGICPLGTDDAQAFLDAVSVDFNGVVNAVDAALPHLVDGGSVVATGSVAGLLTGSTDNPATGFGGLGYSFAKRSVAAFINDLALVLAPRSIRANAVHPTNTNTAMLNSDVMYKQFRPDLEHPTREDALLTFPRMNALPVGFVEPEDIAAMVLFLLSDESRYVTGMQMRVDAGAYVKNRPQQPTF